MLASNSTLLTPQADNIATGMEPTPSAIMPTDCTADETRLPLNPTRDHAQPPNDWYNPGGPAAPLAWYGGKSLYAHWIIEQFPDHRVYVEPFGGVASVLLKKQKSAVEVFNDLDGRIVNLFRVLRDPAQYAEFVRLLHLTPVSREEFRDACNVSEPLDAVQRAWWFFLRCRQARGGASTIRVTDKSWSVSPRTRRNLPEQVSKWLSAVDGLIEVAERFKEVVIEHRPAIELIEIHDARDALIYLDPPYMAATRSGGKAATYACEMKDEDHRRLLSALRTGGSKFILSGYDSPLYRTTLADWRRLEKPTKAQMNNKGGERTEILWLNF